MRLLEVSRKEEVERQSNQAYRSLFPTWACMTGNGLVRSPRDNVPLVERPPANRERTRYLLAARRGGG